MSLSDEQWEFLKDVSKLILKAQEIGIKLTGGELYRTLDQQKIHFKNGKTKTLDSKHLKRLAIDFNFFINGRLIYEKSEIQFLGDYWESLNKKNRWGGNFKSFTDTPHFERNV